MTTQQQRSNLAIPAQDGSFGWYDPATGYSYVVNGWTGGTTTLKTFYRTKNFGVTFETLTDFTFPAHTMATTIVNGTAYVVGGDVYSPTNSGDYIRSSHKCVAGVWSQIASNCGIADRCLSQLVYLDGAFYLFGGQRTLDPADGIYDTVMKSTDDCANFTTINSDTKPNFRGGLHWGAWVAYQGKIYRICGGVYRNSGIQREYDTAVYSTTDGITFIYEGEFPGIGRHYHQAFVHNGRLWVLGGFNSGYGDNLDDMWSASIVNGRLTWRSEGDSSFTGRHALTAWSTPQGIMLFGGTTDVATVGDCWRLHDGQVATPAFTNNAGSVTISCATPGATIYYTTDDTKPTTSSSVYSSAITLGSNCIKAIAVKTGMLDSVMSSYVSAGALDGIANLWLVASSRRLLTSHTGNLIRVRRSSDSTLADIGSNGYEVDTTALAAHVGSGDGFVHTCYDQSGNGRNLTNTTSGKQPQCVYSGVNVAGVNNALAFSNNAGEGRTLTQAATLPEAFTVACWAKLDVLDRSTQVLFDAGGGGVVAMHFNLATDAMKGLVFVGGNQEAIDVPTRIDSGVWFHTAITYDGSSILKLYIDGELAATKTAGNVSASQAAIEWMGVVGSTTVDWRGDSQDLVILNVEASISIVRKLMI